MCKDNDDIIDEFLEDKNNKKKCKECKKLEQEIEKLNKKLEETKKHMMDAHETTENERVRLIGIIEAMSGVNKDKVC